MSERVEVLATCPTHGRQVFRRVAGQRWWECPLTGSFEPGTCGYVIPDETVTPDGGEVVHIDRVQFKREGDTEVRFITAPSPGDPS